MLTKLLSLLSTAKGAAAATVIATAAVTGGVAASNTDVQNAVGEAVSNLTGNSQPAVVTARNGADKMLRDAFQNDQQKLEKLHSSKVEAADRGKLDDVVNTADTKLRARLTQALNDVAALTLGREGVETSASPSPSASPKASPDVKATFTADAQARVDAIVKTAIADMDKIVSDAETAVAAFPTFQPGKPSDVPGGKPSDLPGGKPSDVPGGKQSDLPRPTPTR
jgi:hypothetical protein